MENEYDKQARAFLESTKTEFKAVFIRHGKHFTDDTDNRDIYEITLKRGSREFKFNFGQSIACSGKFKVFGIGNYTLDKLERDNKAFVKAFRAGQRVFHEIPIKKTAFGSGLLKDRDFVLNKEFEELTAYGVLACLTTYDIGDFEEFCDNFGYDNDSINAEKIYKAVLNEHTNLKMLFSDEELDRLGEIQ